MKRVIFSAIFCIGLSLMANTQSSTGSASTATGSVSSTSKKQKSKKAKPSEALNNRRIYHFENGQRSTPTGKEATASSVGGGYAALGKNEASEAKSDTVAKSAAPAANKTKTTRTKRRTNQ